MLDVDAQPAAARCSLVARRINRELAAILCVFFNLIIFNDINRHKTKRNQLLPN